MYQSNALPFIHASFCLSISSSVMPEVRAAFCCCMVLADLEFTLDQTDLEFTEIIFPCLQNTGLKGIHHYTKHKVTLERCWAEA